VTESPRSKDKRLRLIYPRVHAVTLRHALENGRSRFGTTDDTATLALIFAWYIQNCHDPEIERVDKEVSESISSAHPQSEALLRILETFNRVEGGKVPGGQMQ